MRNHRPRRGSRIINTPVAGEKSAEALSDRRVANVAIAHRYCQHRHLTGTPGCGDKVAEMSNASGDQPVVLERAH